MRNFYISVIKRIDFGSVRVYNLFTKSHVGLHGAIDDVISVSAAATIDYEYE